MDTLPRFPPSRFAALRRALSADADGYLRDGASPGKAANTQLAPYLTHGLISSQEVLHIWNTRLGYTLADRLCQTLLWREYFQHVWRHRGEDILADIQPRNAGLRYGASLPADIRMAATGIRAVDESIRQLYSSGHLHHTQRLWLASYVVHLRKIDWRAGAQWMYGHLLDGDLASCYLSWQLVAGNMGASPYLFNAQSVARQAPHLDSAVTALGHSLSDIAHIAASAERLPAERIRPLPQREPALLAHPPAAQCSDTAPPVLDGLNVHIVHPWSLGVPPRAQIVIGVVHLPYHQAFPWSAARWQYVLQRMRAISQAIWVGDLGHSQQWLTQARTVTCHSTPHTHYRRAFDLAGIEQGSDGTELPDPGYLCSSFEIYLQAMRKLLPELAQCSLEAQVARLRRRQADEKGSSLRVLCPDSSNPPGPADA